MGHLVTAQLVLNTALSSAPSRLVSELVGAGVHGAPSEAPPMLSDIQSAAVLPLVLRLRDAVNGRGVATGMRDRGSGVPPKLFGGSPAELPG